MEQSPKIIRKIHPAMGGEFLLMTYPGTYINAKRADSILDKACSEVSRIENKLTDFKDSPFNDINKLAGIKPCKVDDEIFELIEKSILFSKESKGVFDITFACVGHAWRKAKTEERTLTIKEREILKSFINYKNIKLDSKNKTVYLPEKEMKISLGGIGKGYAVDRAFEICEQEGLTNFYINGSGDIRVKSLPSAPRPWKIGLRNPFASDQSQAAGVIQLHNGAIATSGGYIQKNTKSDLKDDHHIINVKSGLSSNEIISSTVIASSCVIADTTATILINLTSKEAIKYLNKFKLSGFIITKDGTSILSDKAIKQFKK